MPDIPAAPQHDTSPPRVIAFVLTPGYALMSLASAVEPLRAANLLAGRELYRIRFLSAGGGFAASTAGGGFPCEDLAAATADFDIAFVVAGGNPLRYEDPALARALRGLHARKVPLGGISGGAAILARHGLMANRRFTVHWLHIDALQELHPDLAVERALFVIDRDRFTCAGGVAAMDMMCAIIAARHGADFARSVSDWFIHPRLRAAGEPQQLDPARRYNLHHPVLESVVGMMSSHLADPLSPAQLAQLSGASLRQLQRLFRDHLDRPMMQFYRELRLDKAEELLEQSSLGILDIALSTGFSSVAHFTRGFAARFGEPPARRRRKIRGG
ncbi:GlxA family transcriptional regulator [Paenirhodobacter populi]|uniref:GlxA family transcriptional regulator n=1 Tax=Paenirhodobacter populi TaxID=2306993 RepID=UPI001F4DB038|nr:GlxA family transcriptional regulator [Sinirhodobacter populi]